jgi:hypothetical protein
MMEAECYFETMISASKTAWMAITLILMMEAECYFETMISASKTAWMVSNSENQSLKDIHNAFTWDKGQNVAFMMQ